VVTKWALDKRGKDYNWLPIGYIIIGKFRGFTSHSRREKVVGLEIQKRRLLEE